MFIAVNTITSDKTAQIKEVFSKMVPELKEFDGFHSFEMWETDGKLVAVSKWETEEQFKVYYEGEVFKRQHNGKSPRMGQSNAAFYTGEVMLQK